MPRHSLFGFYKQNICQAFSTIHASSEQTNKQEMQEMQDNKKCKTTRKQEMQHNICQGIKTIGSTNNIYAKAFINHSYGVGVDTYSPIHHSYGPGVYMSKIFDKKCKPRKKQEIQEMHEIQRMSQRYNEHRNLKTSKIIIIA